MRCEDACELLSVSLRHSAQSQGWRAVHVESGEGRRILHRQAVIGTMKPSSRPRPLSVDNCALIIACSQEGGAAGNAGHCLLPAQAPARQPRGRLFPGVVVQLNASPVAVHELSLFEQPQSSHRSLRTATLQPDRRVLL